MRVTSIFVGMFIFAYVFALQYFLIGLVDKPVVDLLDFLALSIAISVPITISLYFSTDLMSKESPKGLLKISIKILTISSLIFSILIYFYIVQINGIFHIIGHPPAEGIWLFVFWIYMLITIITGSLIEIVIFYFKKTKFKLQFLIYIVITLGLPFILKFIY